MITQTVYLAYIDSGWVNGIWDLKWSFMMPVWQLSKIWPAISQMQLISTEESPQLRKDIWPGLQLYRATCLRQHPKFWTAFITFKSHEFCHARYCWARLVIPATRQVNKTAKSQSPDSADPNGFCELKFHQNTQDRVNLNSQGSRVFNLHVQMRVFKKSSRSHGIYYMIDAC